MTITDHEIRVVRHGLRLKKMSNQDFAKALGVTKSWVSKFLAGEIKSVRDERQWLIEDTLEVQFREGAERSLAPSPIALKVAEAMSESAAMVDLLDAALRLQSDCRKTVETAPWIPPKAMRGFGGKVIAIVDANREKPGKITRLILELIAEQSR